MSNIDKRALREAAEKATPGNWWIDSHGQAMVSFIDNDVLEVFATDNKRAAVRHEDTGNLSRWRNDNDATFIATADPATILALLDELEAVQQGFIANQEEAHEAIKYATELKEQLARACAGREEAFREVDEMQKSLDHTHRRRAIWRGRAEDAEAKLEAAEKQIAEHNFENRLLANADRDIKALRHRIAELEARTVTIPPQAPENLASCLDGYERWLIATTFRDTWNACLAEVVRMNAAGIGKGE